MNRLLVFKSYLRGGCVAGAIAFVLAALSVAPAGLSEAALCLAGGLFLILCALLLIDPDEVA